MPRSQLLVSVLRSLLRSPGPSAVAFLVLTLGLALAITLFAIVDGFLLRQLPFEEGDRLVHLSWATPEGSRRVALGDYLEWLARQRSFEDLAAFARSGVAVSDGRRAQRYSGARISARVFGLLRTSPALGRGFTEEDERPGGADVIVLGDDVWRSQFGADPAVIGRRVLVDGSPATVVGVMPAGFAFPLREEVWLPLRSGGRSSTPGRHSTVDVFGRLRDGVSIEQAELGISLLARQLATSKVTEEAPDRVAERVGTPARVAVVPYAHELMGGGSRDTSIRVGFTAAAFVLLIACANVANLLLARIAGRRRELALHAALGAGRLQMVARVLAETLCLAVPAALAGLVLSALGLRLFQRSIAAAGQRDWPHWVHLGLDGRAVMVAGGLVLVATLLSGLVPALRAARIDPQSALAGGPAATGRGSARLPRALVVGQVALAVALLVPGGLMVRSLLQLAAVDVGFDSERILAAGIGLPPALYPDGASRIDFWRELRRDLRELPGVAGVALTGHVPGPYVSDRETYRTELTLDLNEQEAPWAHRVVISPGFFEALGVGLLEGRDFTAGEGDSPDDHGTEDHGTEDVAERVAIVNRSLARHVWPGTNPLGRRLLLGPGAEEGSWVRVVGVAPDLHLDGLRDRFRAGLYLPLGQRPRATLRLVIRPAAGDAMALLGPLRERVAALDPAVPLHDTQTVADLFIEGKYYYRMVATIFTVLGGASLLLASVGLYALLAVSVARRTAEIGVRMALGAVLWQVRALVVCQGLRQVSLGVVLGLLVAPALALALARQLFGVRPLDPATFVAVPALMLAVAILASWTPAARATRVDPARSLRSE